jgi:hypothetical protein
VRALHEPLEQSARAARLRTSRAPNELVRAAYLVDRDSVERFVSLVGRLQEDSPELRILCTGPWPVYSFTDG